MSLDVAILDKAGYPAEMIQIGVDEHHRLIAEAQAASLALLSRMSDYYEDALFESDEVDDLIAELDVLLGRVRNDEQLSSLISSLQALAETAKSRSTPVVAIAD